MRGHLTVGCDPLKVVILVRIQAPQPSYAKSGDRDASVIIKLLTHIMDSWWSLGEGYGYRGDTLSLYQIQCPFCLEKGNFELEHHAEKKKPNYGKKLNFDTYKCGNCAGYVMVLWSASEYGGGLHNYQVLPWAIGKLKAPEYWPEEVQRFWLQAHESVKNEIWDAAAVMIGSVLQVALRLNKAVGSNLKSEINDLATKGILPPIMREWSDELRLLRNDSAHPKTEQATKNPQDIKDAIEFLDYLLKYLYDLPKQITEYRTRKDNEKKK